MWTENLSFRATISVSVNMMEVPSTLSILNMKEEDLLQKSNGKFVFVSDSDAKLAAALRDDFDRQSCVVHDLSLCVKAALKSNESNEIGVIINASKALVRYFKKTAWFEPQVVVYTEARCFDSFQHHLDHAGVN